MGCTQCASIGEQTVFTPFVAADFSNQFWVQPLIILGFVIAAKLLLDWFFSTRSGLQHARHRCQWPHGAAQGVGTSKMMIIGMALSNALIALGGALFVQTQGGADISIGVGTIVIGLAAVIIGETLSPSKRILDGGVVRDRGRGALPPLYRAGAGQRHLARHRFRSAGFKPAHRNFGGDCLAYALYQTLAAKEKKHHDARRKPQNHLQPGTPIRKPCFARHELEHCRWRICDRDRSNGAGKSTFLNAISGDLAVDSGIICIDNQDVTRLPAYNVPIWWRACFKTRWPALAKP